MPAISTNDGGKLSTTYTRDNDGKKAYANPCSRVKNREGSRNTRGGLPLPVVSMPTLPLHVAQSCGIRDLGMAALGARIL